MASIFMLARLTDTYWLGEHNYAGQASIHMLATYLLGLCLLSGMRLTNVNYSYIRVHI